MSKTIDNQIEKVEAKKNALDRQKKILEREEIKLRQEKLKPLIGMTFKMGNKYAKITGTPRIEWTEDKMAFVPCRIPCLVLEERDGKIVSVWSDTVFSNAINAPDVVSYFKKEYTEIPPELFEEKMKGVTGCSE